MVEKANAQEARGCAYLPELVRSGIGIVGIVFAIQQRPCTEARARRYRAMDGA